MGFEGEEELMEDLPNFFREQCEVYEQLRDDNRTFWVRLTTLLQKGCIPPDAPASEQCFICHANVSSCQMPCGHSFCHFCAERMMLWEISCPYSSCHEPPSCWDNIVHYRFLSADASRQESFLSREAMRGLIAHSAPSIKFNELVSVSFIGMLTPRQLRELERHFSSHRERNSPILQFFYALTKTKGACFR